MPLFEHVFSCRSKGEASTSKRTRIMIGNSQDIEFELKHSKRVRIEKSFGPDFLTYMLESEPQAFKEKSVEKGL